jgi:molybdate/tungstate transport system ATP-binding protein
MSGAEIAVENLCLRFGTFALSDVDLHLAAGEILVLLGPNGAGKSVTLETIAGFHRPDRGRIVIGGRDITGLPPEHRHVGLVFQNFGLFPHLSVARNVAIGTRARASSSRDDAPALMAYFDIAHLAARRPRDLSAGERQRVSLARAFANRPDLFLFDEPFSALDARTRDQLRQDLNHFMRAAGVPAIFVTHDHTDARALADRIAIINGGALVQTGTPAEIFDRPVNAFVAEFVGVENILAASSEGRSGDGVRVAIGSHVLYAKTAADIRDGQAVVLCIRAEDIALKRREQLPSSINHLPARIIAATNLGALTKVIVDCGFELAAYVLSRQVRDAGLAPGGMVLAEVEPASIHVLPAGQAPIK